MSYVGVALVLRYDLEFLSGGIETCDIPPCAHQSLRQAPCVSASRGVEPVAAVKSHLLALDSSVRGPFPSQVAIPAPVEQAIM